MDRVDFGDTGLRVSRLSLGTGSHGWSGRSEQTGLGLEGLAHLLRSAYDLGVTFWDTADEYGSHPHIAKALAGLPREDVVLATKTTARTAQDVTKDIERFLRELKTDVLDVVLLHFMTRADWPQRYAGAMEALSEAQAQGKVRAVGVSCHGWKPLQAAAASDWVEVALVRINYDGTNMDGQPDAVSRVIANMYAAGKAVYGMKVLGCGALTDDPRRGIEYVLHLGTVHALTIGMSSHTQLHENVRLMEELAPRFPLSAR